MQPSSKLSFFESGNKYGAAGLDSVAGKKAKIA
jgi:hypothetical protein